MNNNISNISFNGSFLVNYSKTIPGMREAFETAVGKNGRIILDGFNNKKDVLYILKNSKDFHAADFIKKNELKFEYMPEIDTIMGFEPYEHELVKKFISDNKPTVISKVSELMDYIGMNRTKNKAIKNSHLSLTDKIIQKLHINVKGKKVKDAKGVISIIDKDGDGFVKISPKSKFGTTFVYVKPSNSYDPIMRYAVDNEGNVLLTFKSIDGIKNFHDNFKKAINNHLHIE